MRPSSFPKQKNAMNRACNGGPRAQWRHQCSSQSAQRPGIFTKRHQMPKRSGAHSAAAATKYGGQRPTKASERSTSCGNRAVIRYAFFAYTAPQRPPTGYNAKYGQNNTATATYLTKTTVWLMNGNCQNNQIMPNGYPVGPVSGLEKTNAAPRNKQNGCDEDKECGNLLTMCFGPNRCFFFCNIASMPLVHGKRKPPNMF